MALILLELMPAPARAAPFCVESQGLPAQCLYQDIRQCQEQATRASGICAANPAEGKISVTGTAAYCVVDTSQTARCLYPDAISCGEEARRGKSVCMLNRVAAASPDPFKFDYARMQQ